MKTIEEEALEKCPNVENETNWIDGFIAGVEFARRWIPVDEELPERGQMILAKYNVDSNKCVLVDLYGQVDIDFVKECFDVWRKIELT